jgi:pimeloyl-ACP methyl ester carboxylesterase
MASLIAGAEFHSIPQCGHITFTEKPRETAHLVSTFLQRVIHAGRG